MAAPPPPPPPPPVQSTSTLLPSGWRSSTDSNRQTRSTISASPKPTAPRLDAKTLQHAAAGLRKTEYSRSLRSDFEDLSNGRLDGEDQQLFGRYRPNGSLNVSMGTNQTRAPLYASSNDTRDIMPIGNVYRYTDTLNNAPYTERSSYHPQQNNYMSSSSYYNQQRYSSTRQRSSNDGIQRDTPYITDPKSYIRAYATQTPAYTVMDSALRDNYQIGNNNNYYGTQRRIPSSSNNHAYQFAKELRDQTLTKTQRIANQFQQSQLRDVPPPPQTMESIYRQKEHLGGDQIDSLIRDMEWKLKTGTGAAGEHNCCKCGEGISNERPGCTALNQMFHVACFTCKECDKQLAGGSFYNVDGKPLCEEDYIKSLDRCSSCGEPITEKLLRASGGTYHPACFVCTVCKKCLDGVPFTVDSANNVHCVTCFHEKFAPRCAVCSKPIVPAEGEKESVRVVAMDKSFHVDCYRCEDCNMQLSSKIEGQGCYPLDQHLYCKSCNGKRLIALSKAS